MILSAHNLSRYCSQVFWKDNKETKPEKGFKPCWFVKTDYLFTVFADLDPEDTSRFCLISGSSDITIDENYRSIAENPRVVKWLAPNATLRHPKVVPIGLGIENAGDPGSDEKQYLKRRWDPKTEEVYAAYTPDTNFQAREECLRYTKKTILPRRPFPQYVEELAAHRFCLCPRGNGLDTHRVWEALAVRTVPIVTRSPMAELHLAAKYPIFMLNSWADYDPRDFTEELYERLMRDWDPCNLEVERYVNTFTPALKVGT